MESWEPDHTSSPGSEPVYRSWGRACDTSASSLRCVPPQGVIISKGMSNSLSRCDSKEFRLRCNSPHVTFKPVKEHEMKLETIPESPIPGRMEAVGLSSESGKTVGGYPTNVCCDNWSDTQSQCGCSMTCENSDPLDQEDKDADLTLLRSHQELLQGTALGLSQPISRDVTSAIIGVLRRLSMNLRPEQFVSNPRCSYCTALLVLGSLVSAETSIHYCTSGLDPKTPQAMRWTITERILSSLMTSTAGYLGHYSCECVTDTRSS